MFQIDEPVDYARIQQFAGLAQNISQRMNVELENHLQLDQSNDFYSGLLAGYAHSLATLQNPEWTDQEKADLIGAIVAKVADCVAKRGL